MKQYSKTSPRIFVGDLDPSAPYVDLLDEIIERYSQALWEEGERSPDLQMLQETAEEIIEELEA